jgi:hypothetical protein
MGRRRRVSPEGRNSGRAGFVLLTLGVSALALLLGFLFGVVALDREEGAPPAPAARPVTIEESVQAPEKTVPATTGTTTGGTTTGTTSASATASP